MIIIGYCDWCGSNILEERDMDGEIKIEYTCDCNKENKEDIDEETDYLQRQR